MVIFTDMHYQFLAEKFCVDLDLCVHSGFKQTLYYSGHLDIAIQFNLFYF